MVCLPNWNEFVSIYFGLASLGAVLVPCNTRYGREELVYILQNSGAKAVFVTEDFEHGEFFSQDLTSEYNPSSLEHIFTVRFKKEEYLSYHNLLKVGERVAYPNVQINPAEDVFAILYTSGTTGKPKGVMLTHQNLIYAAKYRVRN